MQTSNVSHEMRTPLSVIIQSAHNLSHSVQVPGQEHMRARFVIMIYHQAELLLSFVNDLLDLDQIKRGFYQKITREFDPQEVIKLVKDMFLP